MKNISPITEDNDLQIKNHTHNTATTTNDGLMSSTDKIKLNNIAENANNYTLPIATSSVLGGVKPDGTTITIDENGIISLSGEGFSGTLDDILDGTSFFKQGYKIQRGVVTTSSGGAGGIAKVEFPTAFLSVPNLYLASSTYNNNSYSVYAGYYDLTATGFTVKTQYGNGNNVSASVQWLAIGEY